MSTDLHTALSDGDAQAIIDVAREAEDNAFGYRTLPLDSDDVVLLPTRTGPPQVLDLEKYKDQPRRTTGHVRFSTVSSFTAYVKTHRSPEHTTIWVHPTSGQAIAVLNDHAPDTDFPGAGWGDHRATLTLEPSHEWETWIALDGKQLPQERFAEHIEDRIVDIVQPSGGDLLDIVQTLTGKTEVEWKAGTRLQDGQVQLRYEETISARAGAKDDLDIPSVFVLRLAPFLGEPRTDVTARLRYRIPGGKLTLGYKLDRPEDIVRRVIESLTERLAGEFGDRVYTGTPR